MNVHNWKLYEAIHQHRRQKVVNRVALHLCRRALRSCRWAWHSNLTKIPLIMVTGLPHTCHARDDFAELFNDKRLQLKFSKQSLAYMSILDKNKNECSVISDIAIHKLLNFSTRYLCEAVFSKLIIITSKNRSFFKNVKNVLRPVLSCINLRMIDLCKNYQVHPSHQLWLITSINWIVFC